MTNTSSLRKARAGGGELTVVGGRALATFILNYRVPTGPEGDRKPAGTRWNGQL